MTRGPVGIIAGSGVYPNILYNQLRQNGITVVVAGIAGHANSSQYPNEAFRYFSIGQINKTASFFKQHGVSDVYMAGGVSWDHSWSHVRPDIELGLLLPVILWRGDDWALRKIAEMFEKKGVRISDAREWIGELLAPPGQLAGPIPNENTARTMARGIQLCRWFVTADAGQAVAVYGDDWVGYENRRGTTALLARTPGPGGVLVKMKKKHQDVRFDRPAIGPSTIKAAKMVGVSAVVVEANEVLLLNKKRIYDDCNKFNISLVAT